jgi:hypothetical protein
MLMFHAISFLVGVIVALASTTTVALEAAYPAYVGRHRSR